MNLHHVIKRPIITEKTLNQTKVNRYTFEVDRRASKGQIKEAVQKYFSVDVTDVHTLKKAGTTRRTGRRRLPSLVPEVKKAIIEVKPGQTIKAFEVKG